VFLVGWAKEEWRVITSSEKSWSNCPVPTASAIYCGRGARIGGCGFPGYPIGWPRASDGPLIDWIFAGAGPRPLPRATDF